MSIPEFSSDQSFDETLVVLNAAFDAACNDLGVADKTSHSRETVAKMIIRFAEGQSDQQLIRAGGVAFLRSRH